MKEFIEIIKSSNNKRVTIAVSQIVSFSVSDTDNNLLIIVLTSFCGTGSCKYTTSINYDDFRALIGL